LATANWSETVSILLGNGDGTFREARTFRAGDGVRALALADFDGDKALDVAVVTQRVAGTESLTVLLGNGDGTLRPPRSFPGVVQPATLAAGDFNLDGLPDVAVADLDYLTPNTLKIFLGNGDGSFQPPRGSRGGPSPVSLAVAEFNGDGIPDLVTGGGDAAPPPPGVRRRPLPPPPGGGPRTAGVS